jgi:hypothetical protein
MPNRDELSEFVAWCARHITGDEKGQAEIFLDGLFRSSANMVGLDAMMRFK